MSDTAYQRAASIFEDYYVLQDALSILFWDTETTMPRGSSESRAKQVGTLTRMGHAKLTHPAMGELLADAALDDSLSDWQKANLVEMRRRWQLAVAVDGELLEHFETAKTRCAMIWREARPADDFEQVRPALEEVVNLARQVAQRRGDAWGLSPYDALLEQYEPGMRAAELNTLLLPLQQTLPPLVEAIVERQAQASPRRPLAGPFPTALQQALARRLMQALGFDTQRGRLDISTHPFCGGAFDDVRITTRYDEANFLSSIMGVLHETGHALYEQNRPREWRYQPVGVARSMGVHESQSLLVEMQVCRSRAFLQFAAPLMREAFGGEGPAWELDNMVREVQQVSPGLIRVDADEVTYPLHITLRFVIEQDLIAGTLNVADLPEVWRAGMQARLGVAPDSDRDGCLQDIHWPSGIFGYFPSYTLGALIAAQLFDAAHRAMPNLFDDIAQGRVQPLTEWLATHIHRRASSMSTPALMVAATGDTLNPNIFIKHLRRRYLGEG